MHVSASSRLPVIHRAGGGRHHVVEHTLSQILSPCGSSHSTCAGEPRPYPANRREHRRDAARPASSAGSSIPRLKPAIHHGNLRHDLGKQEGTTNSMIPVPLFDLKFLT